jgi:ATP-binding cassette subfamily B protein
MAVAAITQLALAAIPLVQKVILDDTILTSRRSRTTWIVVLMMVGTLSVVTNYWRRRLAGRLAVDVQRDLQVRVHQQLQHLDAVGRDSLRAGDIMSRATADIALIQMFLQQLAITIGSLALLVGAVAVMLILSPLLSVVIVACIPVFWWLSGRFRDRSFPSSWMDQRYQGAVAGVVEEAVTGVRIVKAFGREQHELDSLTDEATQLFRSRLRTARISARYSAALQAVPTLGQLGVLGFGGWLAMRGNVTLGVFLAFASYVAQLVTPVRVLSNVMATSQQARAGAERVIELLATQSVVTDGPDARDVHNAIGGLELDDVTFAHAGSRVLDGVSLRIEPGERIAIVGASGSGKSTLALLLARFYDPTRGTVRLDGTDVKELTLSSLRRTVGVVFEDSFLFSGTIRFNIAFGRPDATDAEIEAAARVAQAHEFIRGLPDGYDTVVGERGFTLSGGQRQRVALARAALANPKVLVLDDATSAVDARTEDAIHRSFEEVMARRTTVLIAQRHSTLRLADRIVLLDAGRIVSIGTMDSLLESSALFRELLTGPDATALAPPSAAITAIDLAAWPEGVSRIGAPKMSSRSTDGITHAAGGGGKGVANLTTQLARLAGDSDDLMRAVEQLPPLAGEPDVDLAQATASDPSFSFGKVLRPFTLVLLACAGLVLIDAATSLAAPLLIRRGVDGGVLGGSSRALFVVCLVLLAVQLLSWVNAGLMTFRTSRTAERMLFSLRVRTFAHLQRLSLDFYDRQLAGKIMTRMTSDVDAVAQLVQQGLLTALVSILTSIGVAIVMVVLAPSLTLAVSVVMLPLIAATIWFRRASGRNYMVARERVSVLYADMQESVSGLRVSQAFAQQPQNEARFRVLADAYNAARKRSIEMIARFFPFIQMMSFVAKIIALTVGASQLRDGHITEGVLIAFLIYLDQFFTPIQQLSNVFDQWLQANVAVSQLTDLLRTPSGTPEPADPRPIGRLQGRIELRGAELVYPSTGLVAMRDVDLVIPAGQVVALVGTTGAGKSTLIKLVARFYDPTAGEVLVDGIPLREVSLAEYRHQLGFVPQEPFLFSGTIRSNIAYGRPDAADIDVEQAARSVGAHEFIAGLPAGYHTPVTEEGRSLSAGQRQLLGLARATLADPVILLLDEATANLDLSTEARVQHAMGLVARGRTTILIAHRLQTARAAQRILVVDDGRIVEDGSHDELLLLGGAYAQLWSAFRHSVRDPAEPLVGLDPARRAGAS